MVVGSILAATVLCALFAAAHLGWTMRWFNRETVRDAYFRRPLQQRRELRAEVARRFGRYSGAFRAIAAPLPIRRPLSMNFEGVTAPAMACTPRLFASASAYVPNERDVFVATQMKCGTTWMQQVVYEVLSRGRGDLSDAGHRHMYAMSPWIESNASVSMDDAARVGAGEQRIIKTHLPATLCPYDEKAKYIYVTRNPVACYASSLDFIRMLAGPFAPNGPHLLDWFCSDEMWWRSWPEHVEGWWRWSEERPNVLFVHYEEMLDDLALVAERVARFLDVRLEGDEKKEVVRKSGFDYMKLHEDVFEMTPPTPFSADAVYLKSGKKSRDKDVSDQDRERILAFCRERLTGARYPAEKFYPELARD